MTGLWELSQGDEAKIIAVTHNGIPLKHLSWSHSGTELAVTDILGNISVFSLAIAINHCTVSRRCALGAEDNLSAIVGLSWLNQDRSVSIIIQAHPMLWLIPAQAAIAPASCKDSPRSMGFHGFALQAIGASQSPSGWGASW